MRFHRFCFHRVLKLDYLAFGNGHDLGDGAFPLGFRILQLKMRIRVMFRVLFHFFGNLELKTMSLY